MARRRENSLSKEGKKSKKFLQNKKMGKEPRSRSRRREEEAAAAALAAEREAENSSGDEFRCKWIWRARFYLDRS